MSIVEHQQNLYRNILSPEAMKAIGKQAESLFREGLMNRQLAYTHMLTAQRLELHGASPSHLAKVLSDAEQHMNIWIERKEVFEEYNRITK